MHLDLASLDSIRSFASEFLRKESSLSLLINNAGVKWCPYVLTKDGFEMHIGVNHYGPFLLTNLLIKAMIDDPSRIINLTCEVNHSAKMNFADMNCSVKYDQREAYRQSKLANILFTKELHKRFNDQGISSFAVHPGYVYTNNLRFFSSLLTFILLPLLLLCSKTSKQGAQTVLFCALESGLEDQSGNFFVDCEVSKQKSTDQDSDAAETLWRHSESAVGLTFEVEEVQY